MPRKGHIAKRTVAADGIYGSDLGHQVCELPDVAG